MAVAALLSLLAVPFLVHSGLPALPDFLSPGFYAAFHGAIEIFTVAVAILVFATGFHLLDKKRPIALFLLAAAFLGVALLDFLHLMSYSGMPDFLTVNTPHKAIILWLAARLLTAGALFACVLLPLYPPSTAPPRFLLLAATLAYTFFFAHVGIFRPELVPATFVPEMGLTPFKIAVEWFIILLHAATLAVLAVRHGSSRPWLSFLAPVLLLLIASELFFTLYARVDDTLNMLGHTYKLLAYLLIYRGIFLEAVRQPYGRLEETSRALEYARQEWQETFDAIPDMVFIHDPSCRIIRCNRAYARAAALPFSRIIGQPYYQIFPKSDGPRQTYLEAFRRDEEYEEDFLLAESGRHYNVRYLPVVDEEGEYLHSLQVLRDTTGRRQTEESLQFQLRFQKMVAEISAAFVATPPEMLDNAVDRALALCADFFAADRAYVFQLSPDHGTFDNTHEYCAAGVESFQDSLRNFPAEAVPWFTAKIIGRENVHIADVDGLPHEALAEQEEFRRQGIRSLLCLPLVGDDRLLGFFGLDSITRKNAWSTGQISLLAVVTGIISGALARQQVESGLRESRRFLHGVLESIQDGICILDADQTISHVNNTMEKWYAGNVPLVGRKCYQVYQNRSEPCDPCPALRCMNSGEVEHNEVPGPADSAIEHLEVFCYPIREPDSGKVTRVVELIRDITRRKQMETRMQQTGKMEALGVLAGGIAHDFNNILTPILIHTQMALLETAPSSSLHHSLDQVRNAAQRAASLVRQILDFSRQGAHDLLPVKLSLIVKEALKFLRSSIPPAIELSHELRTDRDMVMADPTQMLQMLMNLAINSVQAMEGKKGRLTIRLEEAAAPPVLPVAETQAGPESSWVRLTVSDTGRGIPAENLKKIFDPFFTTKDKGKGTGMGLAVVHGIVTKHGGTISVQSTPGLETTFAILLPRFAGKTVSPPSQPLPPLVSGNERILVVDDEHAVVDAAVLLLTRLGYQVVSATSGAEALASFRKNPGMFDLVITDYKMPEMTGLDLAAELIRIRSDIPVILSSGFSGPVDEKAARAAGIAAVVAKPFSLNEFAVTVRGLLADRQEETLCDST